MTEEQLEQEITKYDEDFSNNQLYQISIGLKEDLPPEQIAIYAKKKYNHKQMREIRLGLENGLSIEQINLYANPKFNDMQMCEIRYGFQDGLSIEQVSVYNNPKFDDMQMEEIRSGLELGLSIKQVKTYAKPEYNDSQMYELRKAIENNIFVQDKVLQKELQSITKQITDNNTLVALKQLLHLQLDKLDEFKKSKDAYGYDLISFAEALKIDKCKELLISAFEEVCKQEL